ncbi:MAG: hypothetical protein ICV65_01330 [Flavisolibacter sp.]|nr:hypothetical protein [Flavisolibacter sp.]
MKIATFMFLFLALSVACCFSQDATTSAAFYLQKLPPEGIVLDKGWKFHAGDNMEWAKADWDDKGWTPVDPTQELHHLPVVKQAGIGWFRLRLQVDSPLINKTIAVATSSLGASEIYLNGQLVHHFGIVSTDPAVEKTKYVYGKPFSLKLGNQSTQVLAVRYSYNKRNLYLKFVEPPPCIKLVLEEVNQGFRDYVKINLFFSTLRSIEAAFYLPLGILLFFIFISFRTQKEYLHFGLFSFCMFLGILLLMLGFLESLTATQTVIFILIAYVFWTLGPIFLLNGIHTVYELPKKWAYRMLTVYALLVIPFLFLFRDWGGTFSFFSDWQ